MDNYICINGKKAELTEEQMKALGIELPKASPFERVKLQKTYYCMTNKGDVTQFCDLHDCDDNSRYDVANYCTDKSIMEQRALYETLLRLLWRYSMEHKAEKHTPCEIYYDREFKEWSYCYINKGYNFICPRFDSKEIAKNAIKEIVKPFIAEHPNFVL